MSICAAGPNCSRNFLTLWFYVPLGLVDVATQKGLSGLTAVHEASAKLTALLYTHTHSRSVLLRTCYDHMYSLPVTLTST